MNRKVDDWRKMAVLGKHSLIGQSFFQSPRIIQFALPFAYMFAFTLFTTSILERSIKQGLFKSKDGMGGLGNR